MCSFLIKDVFNITRFFRPVTESRVLEGDPALAGLLTCMPQHQGQRWTINEHRWHHRSCCWTRGLSLQIPHQPLSSAGNISHMSKADFWSWMQTLLVVAWNVQHFLIILYAAGRWMRRWNGWVTTSYGVVSVSRTYAASVSTLPGHRTSVRSCPSGAIW